MQAFSPHKFETRVVSKVPRLYISRQAYEDMHILVDEASGEIGWLGTVSKFRQGYLLEEIFLLEQEVSGTTTELSENGIVKLYDELMAEEGGEAKVNALRLWGHSHVNMECFASATDEGQMKVFEENECEYFIRIILNKKGKILCDVFLYDEGLRINDVPWSLYDPIDPERRKMWKDEIAEKCKAHVWSGTAARGGWQARGVAPVGGHHGAHGYYGDYYDEMYGVGAGAAADDGEPWTDEDARKVAEEARKSGHISEQDLERIAGRANGKGGAPKSKGAGKRGTSGGKQPKGGASKTSETSAAERDDKGRFSNLSPGETRQAAEDAAAAEKSGNTAGTAASNPTPTGLAGGVPADGGQSPR